jgi:hypothetical protein
MKYSLAISGLVGLSIAIDPCQDNCGRAVAGSGRNDPPLAVRSSLCSAFVTATSTVTPTAATVTAPIFYNRNAHEARAPAPTAATAARDGLDEKPAYASACRNPEAYWTACQCIPGVKATTVTVSAPAPTVTVPGPVCTQGVEFAIYAIPTDSDRWQNIEEALNEGHDRINFELQFSGVDPDVTGVTPYIGDIVQWDDDWTIPVRIYGVEGPAGSQMSSSVIDHRTWLLPTIAGTYDIVIDTSDNAVYAWVGDVAISGWSPTNAGATRFWATDDNHEWVTFDVSEGDVGKPIAFRLLWLNYGGPGAFSARVIDPNGGILLGPDTERSPSILASCDGSGAPVSSWAPWAEEI